MSLKYLLPELDKTILVDTAASEQCWVPKDNIYDFLLDHLHQHYESVESIFDGGSSGIPHIFEQMILFTNAFYDQENLDHRRAVLEWRAVLALMAFKRIKNLNLDLVKVDLSGSSKNLFIKAAASFVPADQPVFYQTTWDFLYVLLMDNVPIAIFSPTTLVCPAKEFRKKIQGLAWLRIERVNQKYELCFRFDRKGHEFSYLTEWLRMLRGQVHSSELGPDVTRRYEFLIKELAAFIDLYAHDKFPESLPLFKNRLYNAINSSIRDDYSFLNFCCNFAVSNQKTQFLVDKYPADIFQKRILLLVYDKRPNAMFDRQNLAKLNDLVGHIMEIGQRKLISVTESGGEELPFYAFMPFTESFVQELVNRGIQPDDFFDSYQVVYDKGMDKLEVSLLVKQFPFSYQISYGKTEWEKVYSEQLLSIYIWPNERLPNTWKSYYAYVYKDGMDMYVNVPSHTSVENYCPPNGAGGSAGSFQIFTVDRFPSFILLVQNQVRGYLPVKTITPDLQDASATARIYFDVGSTNTSITIVKRDKAIGTPPAEQIHFSEPYSAWVIGNPQQEDGVEFRFLLPYNTPTDKASGTYFRNMLHSFCAYRQNPETFTVKPFKDGHVIFQKKSGGDIIVSMINFNYADLNELGRKRAHIFLEQIMHYAAHRAVLEKCTYMEVRFLHSDLPDEELGALKGLWIDALQKVKERTGMHVCPSSAVDCMKEADALSGFLYMTLVQDQKVACSDKMFQTSDLYASVDIGWKKTLVTVITGGNQNQVEVSWDQISFGGKHLSVLDKEIVFTRYKNLLSLLLSGPYELASDTEDSALLSEFGQLYEDGSGGMDYYYGLFDVIALKIERDDYKIYPDIYNNKKEFRKLIQMLTYNFLLLFYEIGCMLGNMFRVAQETAAQEAETKIKLREIENIYLYLGGNGSKFLNWISNIKNIHGRREITETNCREMFIVQLKETILDVLRQGFLLCYHGLPSTGAPRNPPTDPPTDSPDGLLNCTISVMEDPKRQMLDGYLFRDMKGLFVPDASSAPAFSLTHEAHFSRISSLRSQEFYRSLNRILTNIFEGEKGGTVPAADGEVDMTEVIVNSSRSLCEKIIGEIDAT